MNDKELWGQGSRAVRRGRKSSPVGAVSQAGREAIAHSGRRHGLTDLAALNSNRLEALKGDRKGQYSIRINDQWRICFEWPKDEPGPSEVEIVDYH